MGDVKKPTLAVDWLALWILFSSCCSLAGWLLSAFGCLNALGYALAFAFWGLLVIVFRHKIWSPKKVGALFRWRIFRSRWLFPKIWLALTVLIFAGGILYHPTNYDYLTYRFPRVLNWCWEQKWFWIDTYDGRMNLSATGFEWFMAPLFIYFKTDRLFFLVNFVSFLFLPGLIFSVFSSMGISKRVSWWWMWVLPSAYEYVLQAGSAGNDFFAVVYLLASLRYAFKPDIFYPTRNLALSCLSIALVTGAKASNIPLGLPWLIAIFFNRNHLFQKFKPAVFAGALAVSAMVSFLPLGVMNIRYTGEFSGVSDNRSALILTSPVRGIIGNSLEVAADSLAPPIWFKPISWEGVLPPHFEQWLRKAYPRLAIGAGEISTEESSGIGLGIVASAGLMLLYHLGLSLNCPRLIHRRNSGALWITLGSFVALLTYMSKMGSEAAPRLVAAYYILMIAGVASVASLDGAVMKRSLWKITGCVVMTSAFLSLILSPARPLIPVNLAGNFLQKLGAPSSSLTRFNQVYQVYSSRFDALAALRDDLSPSDTTVGFLAGDDPEVSLWIPFGSRRVIDLLPSDTIEKLNQANIHSIVVSKACLESDDQMTIDDVARKWAATSVVQKNLSVKVQRGEEVWYVIHR